MGLPVQPQSTPGDRVRFAYPGTGFTPAYNLRLGAVRKLKLQFTRQASRGGSIICRGGSNNSQAEKTFDMAPSENDYETSQPSTIPPTSSNCDMRGGDRVTLRFRACSTDRARPLRRKT